MIMVTIAALTLLTTAIGVFYAWRTSRDARVQTWERAEHIEAPGPKRQVYPELVRVPAQPGVQMYRIEGRVSGGDVRMASERATTSTCDELIRRAASARREMGQPPEMPRWSLSLFAAEDAERYEVEWNYHLYVLIQEGKFREAGRVRWRLAVRGIFLAVEVRARRAIRRRGTR